jgi:hypothetical protein
VQAADVLSKIAASNERAGCLVEKLHVLFYDLCMSFLDWPTEEVLPSRRAQQHRRRVVSELFRRFHQAFPEVTYELLWESPTVNAQAWRLGPAQYVRVYGGLVRHPAITKYGLALMLAHETGHHLGGLPRDPDLRWPTWQGQADYWAASEGMPKAFGRHARHLTLIGAKEIIELHRDFAGDEADITPDERLEIFRAGARGEFAPTCLQAAFDRMTKDQDSRKAVAT